MVISLFGMLGLIFTDSLVQTLRSQAKVRLLNQIKQNGQTVLDRLVSEIQQAERVICVDAPADSSLNNTLVLIQNGQIKRFRFLPPGGSDNGQITVDYTIYDNFEQNEAAINPDKLCETSPQLVYGGGIYNLSDQNSQPGLSINYAGDLPANPVFSWDQKAGYNDVINIKFIARQSVSAGAGFESTVSESGILFSTSAGVRGFKQ